MIKLDRKTKETDIKCDMSLEAKDGIDIKTGLGFLDHMLTLMAYHGGFSLHLLAKGDLQVDDHHTVEDIGIVLGLCLNQVIKKQKGMKRYGSMIMPMDEALTRVALDCSGRSVLVFDCQFKDSRLGQMSSQNIKEFFKALVDKSQITLHMTCLYGENDHHKAESLFKGFGHSLKEALEIKNSEDFSTKGVLI